MDPDSITRSEARAPGVERKTACTEVLTSPIVPDTEQGNSDGRGEHEGRRQTWVQGRSRLIFPAFKPYWGKPTVRNFRGGDGNVGSIRRPIRAIALPDR